MICLPLDLFQNECWIFSELNPWAAHEKLAKLLRFVAGERVVVVGLWGDVYYKSNSLHICWSIIIYERSLFIEILCSSTLLQTARTVTANVWKSNRRLCICFCHTIVFKHTYIHTHVCNADCCFSHSNRSISCRSSSASSSA